MAGTSLSVSSGSSSWAGQFVRARRGPRYRAWDFHQSRSDNRSQALSQQRLQRCRWDRILAPSFRRRNGLGLHSCCRHVRDGSSNQAGLLYAIPSEKGA